MEFLAMLYTVLLVAICLMMALLLFRSGRPTGGLDEADCEELKDWLEEQLAAQAREFNARQDAIAQQNYAAIRSVSETLQTAVQSMSTTLGQGQDSQQRILERLGYLLGRYIYMADALDDWEKDRKSGSFNPFLQAGGEAEALRRRAKESLNLTIGEIGATFDLLTLQRFQPVLENIIHLGLSATVEELQLPPKQRRKRYP